MFGKSRLQLVARWTVVKIRKFRSFLHSSRRMLAHVRYILRISLLRIILPYTAIWSMYLEKGI